MAGQYWWWSVAIVLAVAEMATGTFYLLVLAASACISGVLAWLGAGEVTQVLSASLSTIVGVFVLHYYKKRCMSHNPKLGNNLDIGQTVEVLAWLGPDGRARVHYRGTQWDARLLDLDAPKNERMRIVGNEASTLLLAPLN